MLEILIEGLHGSRDVIDIKVSYFNIYGDVM